MLVPALVIDQNTPPLENENENEEKNKLGENIKPFPTKLGEKLSYLLKPFQLIV